MRFIGSILGLQMKLAQLFRVDRRRRPSHEVDRVRGLWERDHLADRGLAGENRDDTVEAERDAAVRRRPVLERLQEEAEPQLRILFGNAQPREDARLQLSAVD